MVDYLKTYFFRHQVLNAATIKRCSVNPISVKGKNPVLAQAKVFSEHEDTLGLFCFVLHKETLSKPKGWLQE